MDRAGRARRQRPGEAAAKRSGGAALTWTDDANGPRRHWWSPVGVAAVGWRWTIPDAVLGFELRASALRNDTTTVSTVAAILAIGHAW